MAQSASGPSASKRLRRPLLAAPVLALLAGCGVTSHLTGTDPASQAITLVPCPNRPPPPFLPINEAPPPAADGAPAPFPPPPPQLGPTSTTLTGLNNASLPAASIADSPTGLSPASHAPANAIVNSSK